MKEYSRTDLQNTLFVSDLDGTLLLPDATLSPSDAEQINALSTEGIRITYATARTIQSVRHILSPIRFDEKALPISLMNGVLLYDPYQKKYINKSIFSKETAQLLLKVLTDHGVSPFIYALLPDDQLLTFYHSIVNEPMRRFMNERIERYQKPFKKVDKIDEIKGDVIYFCLIADQSTVLRAIDAISKIMGIRHTSYRDVYLEDTWYLEVFDKSASKKNAINNLKQYCNAKKIIAFGDNLNDLPMFEAADYSVAVKNAHPTLLKSADAVAEHGVVEWIKDYIKQS